MIAFVETGPAIEPHELGFVVSLVSGDAKTFLLTRHAFTALLERGRLELAAADAKAAVAALVDSRKVVPFPKPKRGRQRGNDGG